MFGLGVALVFWLLGRRGEINSATGRFYYGLASRLLQVEVEFVDAEDEALLQQHPAVLVANHQSMLDILVLGRIFPSNCVVMAKKVFKYYPLMGQFMVLARNIFIDRLNHQKALDTFSRVIEEIKQLGMSVFIFPEGTRAHLEKLDLLPFKKGAFHLAQQAQIPVIPVVFSSFKPIYDKKDKKFLAGVIYVKVLKPVPTLGLTGQDVTELSEKVRADMLETFKQISHHD